MTTYPAIRKACLEIAYDNGGVNRHREERQVCTEIDTFLASRPYIRERFGAYQNLIAIIISSRWRRSRATSWSRAYKDSSLVLHGSSIGKKLW